jgi:putative membrane protein
MDIKRTRGVFPVLHWTRWDILILGSLATIPTFFYQVLQWKWIALPWLPIAVIGTAVSFMIGFKNNASYDRAWEARQIWGAIVNASRSLMAALMNYVGEADLTKEEKEDIYLRFAKRQVGWLTTLRYQLREPKQWEAANKYYNAEFRSKNYVIDEYVQPMNEVLEQYLLPEELDFILKKNNKPSQVLAFHSKDISRLSKENIIDRFQQVDLQNIIENMYTHQGGSERIKNFPYPGQYATLNLFFVRVFTFLVPFGMLHEFETLLGADFVWLAIPFSVLVGWVFNTMEKIGEASENPFEGGTNDIPITQISRNIEIDLLDMIHHPHHLPTKQPQNDVLT